MIETVYLQSCLCYRTTHDAARALVCPTHGAVSAVAIRRRKVGARVDSDLSLGDMIGTTASNTASRDDGKVLR